MAAGNFDEVQDLLPDGSVDTKGPLDDSVETIMEFCVWVAQRTGKDADGAPDTKDAGATDMTNVEVLPVSPGSARKWHLPAKPIDESKRLIEGPAIAMAIAMFKVKDTAGVTNRVQLWSQAIELKLKDVNA